MLRYKDYGRLVRLCSCWLVYCLVGKAEDVQFYQWYVLRCGCLLHLMSTHVRKCGVPRLHSPAAVFQRLVCIKKNSALLTRECRTMQLLPIVSEIPEANQKRTGMYKVLPSSDSKMEERFDLFLDTQHSLLVLLQEHDDINKKIGIISVRNTVIFRCNIP
jgi:hypothetical protein